MSSLFLLKEYTMKERILSVSFTALSPIPKRVPRAWWSFVSIYVE